MIRAARERVGWSQQNLAEALQRRMGWKVHQTQIGKLESGRRPVRMPEAIALSEVLGLDVTCATRPENRSINELERAETAALLAAQHRRDVTYAQYQDAETDLQDHEERLRALRDLIEALTVNGRIAAALQPVILAYAADNRWRSVLVSAGFDASLVGERTAEYRDGGYNLIGPDDRPTDPTDWYERLAEAWTADHAATAREEADHR